MTVQASLRRCTPGDETALALVGQATFLETFAGVLGGKDIVAHCVNAHAPELYRSWLVDSHYALWIVEASPDQAPIGYMVVAPPQLPLPDIADDLELKRIYLLSKFQRGGLGGRLVSTAIAYSKFVHARRLLLGVHAHNRSAIGFYGHFGFRKIGTRQFHIGGHDYDDDIMGSLLNT
jgi:ribosomal protein S18 acetylase RimI-like enzyme